MTGSPQALRESLEDAYSRLPDRTLFGLALAGLRTRLTRSVVTLVSVVLAIAYLSYSGINAAHVQRLAEADNDEVNLLLRAARINAETAKAGNPIDRWLILMAILTCSVGIANAMLMSVTERFREIGTMKCLGAEDGAVVKLFLIESALVGVVGSGIGVALGLVIALLVGALQFGGFAWTYLPYGAIGLFVGLSFVTGLVLCLAGAGYPAFLAARMRPVDALRVEE